MKPFRLPVDKPYTITTEFGQQPGYILNAGFHKGLDFVTANRRIYLVYDANIELYPLNGTDGNAIYATVNTPQGSVRFAYCHMANFAVSQGFHTAGTYLGEMGATGAADGVHLHFATRLNGTLVDPRTLIDMEGEVTVEAQDVKNIYAELFKAPAPAAVVSQWAGKSAKDFAYWLVSSAESKAYLEDLRRWKQAGMKYSDVVNAVKNAVKE